MSFPNCSDAYDSWKKQMNGSLSTKNQHPCNKQCYCSRNSVKRVQIETETTQSINNNKTKKKKEKH